ncbi:hypothetical protein SAMN06269185_0714 [Natronoarchaeum philippinense]|uniref:GRAM domain-containing protein n=1 Tax=Natronoarchaeum philippinense TaxID=558529 RepID=A0A285N5Y7_NATPI|nr:hypothetical protein [Natronoarchaeum philippinense]SNZ04895.1 hypothetical protein SAMN06269185_0714 [Natronoarchaeum philippinense]
MSALDLFMKLLGEPSRDDLDRSDTEAVQFDERANHTQNRRRAVGGKLFVTDRRVVFVPHTFDDVLGGAHVDVPLDAVETVTTEPADRSPGAIVRQPLDTLFGGSLRTRLRIETADGDAELFLVDDIENAIDVIDGARDDRVAEP